MAHESSLLIRLFLVLLFCLLGTSYRTISISGNKFYSKTDFFAANDKSVELSKYLGFKRCALTLVLSLGSVLLLPSLSSAVDSSWTDKNRLAAETWRAVDENFLDRTFNNQDWLKLRMDVVKKQYKTNEEVYDALKDMISKLGDRYTRYLPPAQYTALMNSATGDVTGVGLELATLEDGSVQVNNIAEGSPAFTLSIEKSDIPKAMPGDIISNVDGSSTKGLSAEEVASLIRGKEGTKATLELVRKTTDKNIKVLNVAITRHSFKLKGVNWSKEEVNGKKVGFIGIKSFATTTRDEVIRAMESIESGDDLDCIVIDMRNNGGGLLQGAIQVANLFLPPGKVIVYEVGKDLKQQAQMTLPDTITSADPHLPDLKTKLYVLVNSNTASAAEVLAGCFKDQGRGALVGEQTFGKGVIQNLQQLQDGSGVAITIQRYETPNHNNINKVGIPVDKEIDFEKGSSAKECAEKFI